MQPLQHPIEWTEDIIDKHVVQKRRPSSSDFLQQNIINARKRSHIKNSLHQRY